MFKLSMHENKQAHKVCIGQNELVMSLLENFGLNLTLILPWNEGRSQILNMNILTCVAMINHEIYEVYSHLIFLSYIHFKTKINESALVWTWNLGQIWKHFLIPWVWLPIPCK
jgi:hypothetical protein